MTFYLFFNLIFSNLIKRIIVHTVYIVNEPQASIACCSHMADLIPGGCRKGRADELLPIAIGGFIPGVSLDVEFLPSQAQTTSVTGDDTTMTDLSLKSFCIENASRDM